MNRRDIVDHFERVWDRCCFKHLDVPLARTIKRLETIEDDTELRKSLLTCISHAAEEVNHCRALRSRGKLYTNTRLLWKEEQKYRRWAKVYCKALTMLEEEKNELRGTGKNSICRFGRVESVNVSQ